MRKLSLLIAMAVIAAFAVPAAAFAAQGYATADVHMRAGPSTEYPIVTTVPERAEVEIYGCLDDRDWCDVSWAGYRGWVSAHYLEYYYEGHYVYLPDYFEVIHVPIVTFILGSYWEQHYRDRPWFHNRTHWERYWQTHRPPPVRPRPGLRVVPPAPTAPVIRPPERRTPSVTRPERRTPSIRTPERRVPSTTPPVRRSPSVTTPQRRVPSTQSGSPQQAPRQLQAPRRSVTTPHPTTRSGSGGTIQRTTPHSGTAAPSGQPAQRKKRQQQ